MPRRTWSGSRPWYKRTTRPSRTSISTGQGRSDRKRRSRPTRARSKRRRPNSTTRRSSAPIDGVVGFRQVDIGNIIHTTDPNPLTVLTQIKPCVAIFTLPQNDLGPVREAMLQRQRLGSRLRPGYKKQLAQGQLLLINNQIDQATSTIRLKAEFPNEDERLWPGEFVRIRMLVTTRKDAVTIPPVAVQRGPGRLYSWVVKPDNTVEQRRIEPQTVNDDVAIVTKGLALGEQVVVDGQSRLDDGTRVDVRTARPAASAGGLDADEYLGSFYPPADRDVAVDGGVGSGRDRGVSAVAGRAAAASRLSDHRSPRR